MKNDPFCLFSKKEKASLGILSADGNFGWIVSKDFKKVNEILFGIKYELYKPPYTIISKILNLISKISEHITELKYNSKQNITPMLRKKNRIKTLVGTREYWKVKE